MLQIREQRNCGNIILPWKKFFEIYILNILGIPHNLHGSFLPLSVCSPSKLLLPSRKSHFPSLLTEDFLLAGGPIQSAKKRRKVPNGYWEDVENRRKFFAEFAQSKGFDPLDSHRWNQYYATDVIKHQVRSCCSFPLSYHTLLFL